MAQLLIRLLIRLSAAACLALASGCGADETGEPEATEAPRSERDSRGGQREIPPGPGESGRGDAPEEGTESGGQLPDANPRPWPGEGDEGAGDAGFELVELTVPDSVEAWSSSLVEDAWRVDRPLPDCSSPSGIVVPARAYRLRNPDTAPAEVRVGIRTAAAGGTLTLPDGTLFAYAEGALPGATSCSASGATSPVFTSEIEGLTVPGLGALELVVASTGPNGYGTYQLTVIRVDEDTGPVGGGPPAPGDSGGDASGGGDPGGGADPEALCSNTCEYAADGECDDGGPGSDYDLCPLGTDCDDCGSRPVGGGSVPGSLCEDSCLFAADGMCDDGGPGALVSACTLGTDCSDCGPRSAGLASCQDTCVFAFDGMCDDGGVGSVFSFCARGTDCADCGPR